MNYQKLHNFIKNYNPESLNNVISVGNGTTSSSKWTLGCLLASCSFLSTVNNGALARVPTSASNLKADWHQICSEDSKFIAEKIKESRLPGQTLKDKAFKQELFDRRMDLRVQLKKEQALKAREIEKYLIPFLGLKEGPIQRTKSIPTLESCNYFEKKAPFFLADYKASETEIQNAYRAIEDTNGSLMKGLGVSEFSYVNQLIKLSIEYKVLEMLDGFYKPNWKNRLKPESAKAPKGEFPAIYPVNFASKVPGKLLHRKAAVYENNPILARPARKAYGLASESVLQRIQKKFEKRLDKNLEDTVVEWLKPGIDSTYKFLVEPLNVFEVKELIGKDSYGINGIDVNGQIERWSLQERKYVLALQIFFRNYYSQLIRYQTLEVVKKDSTLSADVSRLLFQTASTWQSELEKATFKVCSADDVSVESDPYAMGLYLSRKPDNKTFKYLDAYCHGGWGKNKETVRNSVVTMLGYTALAATVLTPLPGDEVAVLTISTLFNTGKLSSLWLQASAAGKALAVTRAVGAGSFSLGSALKVKSSYEKTPLFTALYQTNAAEQAQNTRQLMLDSALVPASFLLSVWSAGDLAGSKAEIIGKSNYKGVRFFDTPLQKLFNGQIISKGGKIAQDVGGTRISMLPYLMELTPKQLALWGVPVGITLGNSIKSFSDSGLNPFTEIGFWSDAVATTIMYGASVNMLYAGPGTIPLMEKLKNTAFGGMKAVAVFLATDSMIQSTRLLTGKIPNQRVMDFIINWCPTGMYANQFLLVALDQMFENFVKNPMAALILSLARVPIQTYIYSKISYKVYANMYVDRESTYLESLGKTWKQFTDPEYDQKHTEIFKQVGANRFDSNAHHNVPLIELSGTLGNGDEFVQSCSGLDEPQNRIRCAKFHQENWIKNEDSKKVIEAFEMYENEIQTLQKIYNPTSESRFTGVSFLDQLSKSTEANLR